MNHQCLVCEEELEPQSAQPQWPWGAVVARLHGMYGSTVYDPPGSRTELEHLHAFVCDRCLLAKARSGLIQRVVKWPRDPEIQIKPWKPDIVPD